MRLCFSMLLGLTLISAAAEWPVAIGAITAGTPGKARITNSSTQPATAWSLAVTTESPQGRRHREIYTTDGYLSEVTHGLPNAVERLERLMPGESREVELDSVPPGAKVEVIAVVMGDGTAIGDAIALTAIFSHRVEERDGLKAVVDAFNEVLAANRGAEALSALRTRLASLVTRYDNVPCHAALDAVQTYARKGDADDIDRSLHMYADFVAKEYELAARHSARRTKN